MTIRELSLRGLLVDDSPRPAKKTQTTASSGQAEENDGGTTAYVSLVDLRDDSSGALLLFTSGSDSELALLVDATAQRMQRVQDVLLMHIVGLSLALVIWACDQLYSGRVCALVGATHARTCSALAAMDDSRGAPDALLVGPVDSKNARALMSFRVHSYT
ncbi:hypothetical protein PINS_up003371 [Pythium insidiosum]|nr:hypothetical protein PINS_up003371 [Pythium insidiosum]